MKGRVTRSLKYFLRILFVPYKRMGLLKHNIMFYGVSLFFFVLALALCQFRLAFMDPKLLEIYESKYSNLTGTYHYLPGKFEVLLVGFVFVPIWVIHFIFATNLNIFYEEEKEPIENQQIVKKKLDKNENANPRFSQPIPKLSEKLDYRKKVILVSTWDTLSYPKKILRGLIVLIPIFVLLLTNTGAQYMIASLANQGNFNLFNIAVNLIILYFLVFHFTVFIPLMFLRAKVLIEGDYLWSSVCNFVI